MDKNKRNTVYGLRADLLCAPLTGGRRYRVALEKFSDESRGTMAAGHRRSAGLAGEKDGMSGRHA
jgi:hypothetical protein